MKKILFINSTYGTGGAPKVAKSLFDYLNKDSGYEAYFAYGRGEEAEEKNVVKIGYKWEIYLHAFLVRFLGIEGYGSYFSTLKLINFIKKEKFDVIHLHNIHGYYLNFFRLFDFLKTTDIKIIWTLHDEWAITSLKAHSMGCLHCKTGKGKCTSSYPYPKTFNKLFLKWMLSKKKKTFGGFKNMTIIAPAKWLTDNARKSFLGNYPVINIPNGVDTNIFYPRENKEELRIKYGAGGKSKVVVFSANNLADMHKGASYVLRVAEKLEDKDILFVGIGKGFKSKVENVRVLGRIDEENKISEILGMGDIFLFPTLAETASLALLEAMASGLSVVAFDIEANKEIIGEKEGLLAKSGDLEELVRAVDLVLGDEKALKNKEKLVRDLITNKYKKEFFLAKHMEIY